MNLSIPDMSCGHCRASITQALTALDPSVKIEIDPLARTARIDTAMPENTVIATLAEIGFDALPA